MAELPPTNEMTLIEEKTFEWQVSQGLEWKKGTDEGNSAEFFSYNFGSLRPEPKIFPKDGGCDAWKNIKVLAEHGYYRDRKCLIIWIKHDLKQKQITFMVEITPHFHDLLKEHLSNSFDVQLRGILRLFAFSGPKENKRWILRGTEKTFDIKASLEDPPTPISIYGVVQESNIGKAVLQQVSTTKETWKLECELTVAVTWARRIVKFLKLDPGMILWNGFRQTETMDVTLIVAGGKQHRCHKVILGAHSSILHSMLLHPADAADENGVSITSTNREGILELPELSDDSAKLLIEYFYGMELQLLDLTCDKALELFKFSNTYDLSRGKLEKSLVSLFVQKKDAAWFSPDVALDLYFFLTNLPEIRIREYRKLQEHLLKIMIQMIEAVKQSEYYNGLESQVKIAFLWTLLDSART